MRSVRGPVSPKQDTLGDWGGDDASAPLLVLIGINLAPAEFKQGDVVTQREIPMAKHILMLTTVTFALVYGGIPARAQEDSDDTPQSCDIGRKRSRTRATKKTPAGRATA